MDEKFIGIFGTIVVLVSIIVGVFMFMHPMTNPAPPQQDIEQKQIQDGTDNTQQTHSTRCSSVSGQCLAKETVVADKCNFKQANMGLRQKLSHPLDSLDCKLLESDLREKCQKDCWLDSGNMLVVTGKIEIGDFLGPDKKGACLLEGTRAVVVKASCSKTTHN